MKDSGVVYYVQTFALSLSSTTVVGNGIVSSLAVRRTYPGDPGSRAILNGQWATTYNPAEWVHLSETEDE